MKTTSTFARALFTVARGRPGARGALGVLAMFAIGAQLFACESSDTSDQTPLDTDASTGDASPADAGGDANDTTDASDHDAEDDFVVPDASVVCGTGPCAKAITGHGDTFCVVLQNGKTSCWGSNASGQLGYDAEGEAFSATAKVAGALANVTHASVGDGNTCARLGTGEVYCWGAPTLVNAGLLAADAGEAYTEPVTQPTRVNGISGAENVAVGKDFACVTAGDGSLTCWGTNESRELGRGAGTAEDFVEAPAKASLVADKVTTVAPGIGRTFVIDSGGDLISWGAGSFFGPDDFGRYTNLVDYLLGRDVSENVDGIPTLVARPTRVRALASSSMHVCAIANRDVWCWGTNALGQLGRGSYNPAPTVFQLPPSFMPDISNLRFVADAEKSDGGFAEKDVPLQVAVADTHSCAVMGSGRVYCWGKAGDMGLLGPNPSQDIIGIPTRIDGLSEPAVGIAVGDGSVCALLRSGAVECWGANGQGQLGTTVADELPHPTPSRVVLPN